MWYCYVIFLILCPTDPQVSSQAPPQAWQALKEISLALEIVGPHENWASDFRSELRYVRYYWGLLRYAPRLADCCGLPSNSLACEQCRFNEEYQCYLQTQQCIFTHRTDDLGEVLRATRQLHQAWDCLRRASAANQAWAYRRRMLVELRDLIGMNAYYNGRMPPSVPMWCFKEIE